MIECLIKSAKSKSSILSFLLLPFSYMYSLFFILFYYISFPRKVPAKVICVGNVIAGGAGKTPFVQHIASQYKKCAIILRGYGGSLAGNQVIKVDLKSHTFKEVGDEAMLHAQIAPTYICSNRYLAAKAACEDGAEVIIMDDGFQNFTLHKDRSILVFDSEFGIGNGRVLPSGLLREQLSFALNRADELVLLSYDSNFKKPFNAQFKRYEVCVLNKKEVKGMRFIAMCAIGNPNKFLKSLKGSGVSVVKEFKFPDHHSYSNDDLEQVIESAKKNKCKVITTSKDFVKISEKFRKHFVVLQIGLKTM